MSDNYDPEVTRRLMEALEGISRAANPVITAEELMAQKAQENAKALGAFGKNLTVSTSDFTKSMLSASDGTAKYAGSIQGAASAANQIASNFGFMGKAIGAVTEVLGKLAGGALKQNEALIRSYRSLSKVGDLGRSLDDIKQSMHDAGFSVDESADAYVAAFSKMAPGLALFGGSVEEGRKKLNSMIKNGLGEAEYELQRFGYSSDEIFESVGNMMGVLAASGGNRKKQDSELFAITKDYLTQLSALSALTGQQRAESERNMQKNANDLRFQMMLNNMQKSGNEDMIRGAKQMSIMIASLPAEQQEQYKAALVAQGQVTDEFSAEFFQSLGDKGYNAMIDAAFSQSDKFPEAFYDMLQTHGQQFQEGFDQFGHQFVTGNDAMKGFMLNISTWNSAQQSNAREEKVKQEWLAKIRDLQEKGGQAEIDENTERIKRERKLRNAYEQFEFQLAKQILPLLSSFQESLEALGSSMADFAYTFSAHTIDVRDMFRKFGDINDVSETMMQQTERQIELGKEEAEVQKTIDKLEKEKAESLKKRKERPVWGRMSTTDPDILDADIKSEREKLANIKRSKAQSEAIKKRAQGQASEIYSPDTANTERAGEGDLSGLVLKTGPNGAMRPGGKVTPELAKLARQIQSEVPGFVRFTSLDDAAHALDTNSLHNKGKALDFTVDQWPDDAMSQATIAKLKAMGFNKVLDEYNNPSASAWQKARELGLDRPPGHFHAELKAKNGGFFSGPNTGYNVTLHGDEIVTPVNKGGVTQSPLSGVTGRESREMYRVFNNLSDKMDMLIDLMRSNNGTTDELLTYAKQQ